MNLNLRLRASGTTLLNLFPYVQDASNWTEWSGRSVSLPKALELEAEGKAERIIRSTEDGVQIVG